VSADRKPTSDNSESAAIGRRIRLQRERKGLTQLKLAVLTGLTPVTIWRLESGFYSDQQVSTLRTIANALEITVGMLTDPEPNGEPAGKAAS